MSQSYLVPDYYPQFACKMGACRHACCVGWPISITLNDYFRLLGVECSPDLRRRIDVALHIAPRPMPEAYAQILPRYDGQCPLRMEDGRCQVQAELGEEALATVCRLYPRGVRTGEWHECSCANSCEAVLELLLNRTEPLDFVELAHDFRVPEATQRVHRFEDGGRGQEIRLWFIRLMQRREYPLHQRLLLLGTAMRTMDDALSAHDADRVDALLTGREKVDAPSLAPVDHQQLQSGLDIVSRMISMFDETSVSIREYGEAALHYFGEGEAELSRFVEAEKRFCALVPQWTIWFEHMMVNHMFFTQFPFQDRPVSLQDEYVALCAVYALTHFLCVGYAAQHSELSGLVDVAAAAFRLMEHTEFDRYASVMLKQLGQGGWSGLQPG